MRITQPSPLFRISDAAIVSRNPVCTVFRVDRRWHGYSGLKHSFAHAVLGVHGVAGEGDADRETRLDAIELLKEAVCPYLKKKYERRRGGGGDVRGNYIRDDAYAIVFGHYPRIPTKIKSTRGLGAGVVVVSIFVPKHMP